MKKTNKVKKVRHKSRNLLSEFIPNGMSIYLTNIAVNVAVDGVHGIQIPIRIHFQSNICFVVIDLNEEKSNHINTFQD